MKTTPARKIDGGRQRCVGCGHPRVEHRQPEGCTVPNCVCRKHELAESKRDR